MPLKGELAELPLMDLLQILLMNKKTGVLIVERDHLTVEEEQGDRADIFLRDGQARFISSKLGKSLSEVVSALGYTAPRRSESGLEINLLVEVLESDSPLRADIAKQVKKITEERMGELLRWKRGRFIFKEIEVPSILDLVEVDSLELLVQGARHVDEWEMVSAKLPSFEVVPNYPEKLPDGILDFTPAEWRVLLWVNGERSVREISDQFPESTFEVAKAVVSLVEKGVVVIEERKTTPRDIFPVVHRLLLSAWERFEMEEYDQAENLATQALALDPSLSVAHLFLAEVYYAQGRYKDAARRYIEVIRRDKTLAGRVNFHLACALIMSGDFEFALGVLDEAAARDGHQDASEIKSILESLLSRLRNKEKSFEE